MKTIIDVSAQVVNTYQDPNEQAADWVLGIFQKVKAWWRKLWFSSTPRQSVAVVVPTFL